MIIDSIQNKRQILNKFLELCKISGWNDETLRSAMKACGFDPKFMELIFEKGALDIADFLIRENDAQMLKAIEELKLDQMRIRDKIKEVVKIRILLNQNHKIAIKKLIGFYSKAKQIPYALRNSYKTADLIWYQIGDKSTDFNFYSKRIILSKIYIRTLMYFVKDNSENNQKTWEVLDSQIEKVMKFEKLKFQVKNYISKTKDLTKKVEDLQQNFSKTSLKNLIKKLPFFRLTKND